MTKRLALHAILLWLVAPWLLILSVSPPSVESGDRARYLPRRIGSFEYVRDHRITPAQRAMLGTDDARTLEYHRDDGGAVYLTTVFHDTNWKSVHPPHLCLRGSDMTFVVDEIDPIELADGSHGTVGHLELVRIQTGRSYISLFAFVAPPDLLTGDYWTFFFHHLPSAVLRRGASGCLARIEADVVDGDREAALARCREFAKMVLPKLARIVEQH